jgi:Domain of unknown function (DUF4145)
MGIDDRPPRTSDELQERNISTTCPHCGETVALTPAHPPINTNDRSYFIGFCPNHKRRYCKPIFAAYEPVNNLIEERYPIPTFAASSMHKAIPERIREDYTEGTRCMYADSWKAVVVMCRRVVEAVACDKLGAKAKGPKGDTLKLHALISLLQTEGLITRDLKESADELRHFGNYGAHVQDDGLDKVKSDEARNVREITWQLLYSIYVAPSKTEELRKSREARKKS